MGSPSRRRAARRGTPSRPSILVARRDTGEATRFDQQFELSFRPETRARYERTWFPDHARGGAPPRALPGEDRGAGPQQRASGQPDPRVRGAGALGPAGFEHDIERPAAGGAEGGRPRSRAHRSPELLPLGLLHCTSRSTARRGTPGRPQVTAGFSIRRSDGRFLAVLPESPLTPGPDGALDAHAGDVHRGGASRAATRRSWW